MVGHDPELRHLRAFVAIADEGNLTRAAARLHLTQPALSRTLQQLEAHLGVRLVQRSTHHLELTPAGQVFRDRARAALAAVDEALDPARAATWPLRLGHAWSALGPYTTALLRRWRQIHPQIPLELLRIDDRTAGLDQGKSTPPWSESRRCCPTCTPSDCSPNRDMAVVPADSPLADACGTRP